MAPVMQYADFRKFLRDFYAERKPYGFSYREFSQIAGYKSPVFMKLVIEGRANLSEIGTERVANALGLAGADLNYFRLLVAMNQSKDPAEKKDIFKKLRDLGKANKVKIVGKDQYDYYESWLSPVLREALPVLQSEKASEIADKLAFKSSAAEIKQAIRVLLDAGLLSKDASGNFVQTDRKISTGDLEIPSIAVRDMHRQMGKLAVQALDEIPAEERDISGLTVGVAEESVSRIKTEIAEFRHRIASIVTETPKTSRVYRLNVQFFPLTGKLADAAKPAEQLENEGGER